MLGFTIEQGTIVSWIIMSLQSCMQRNNIFLCIDSSYTNGNTPLRYLPAYGRCAGAVLVSSCAAAASMPAGTAAAPGWLAGGWLLCIPQHLPAALKQP